MQPLGPPQDPSPDPSDRLNGWKEIASFLGKGVRTVQRWEKELGLPVHRLGKEGGEIIFALKSELQRWTVESENARRRDAAAGHGNGDENGTVTAVSAAASGATNGNDPAPAQPAAPPRRPMSSHPPGRLALSLIALAVALAALAAWRGSFRQAPAPPSQASGTPAEWAVEDDTLRVYDDGRRLLWRHRFPTGLPEGRYIDADARAMHATIEDLDGDGTREVAFIAAGSKPDERLLFVFNSDGSTRFVDAPSPTVHFGDTAYAPYWWANRLFITRDAGGRPSLWAVYIHDRWFPTLVRQLDANGRVLTEYWSNGYVEYVTTGTWRGRPVTLVAGTNNEHRGASLAIFDGTGVQGSAPAAKADYTCTDCPPGRPLAFVVFPRTCTARIRDGQALVYRAWTAADDRIIALVRHGESIVNGVHEAAEAFYTLGPDLAPERVELSREFMLVHSALQQVGQLDHAFGPSDEKDFFPLLRWDGDRFTALPAAPVKR